MPELKIPTIDQGRPFDWGKTSEDYATYRSGPPASFYQKLASHDIGVANQRILDLGTGTGLLARAFAQAGAVVSGIDASPEQIQAARKLAVSQRLEIEFRCSPAESTTFDACSFDVLTASQCWFYFDQAKALAEAKRLLAPNGLLMVSNFYWLPRRDPIAKASEGLILKFNPQWSAADLSGEIPLYPKWAENTGLVLQAMFFYDEQIPYDRESWRGRIRACRGIGASLDHAQVKRFDQEHERLLAEIAPERFSVLHRISAHILEVPAI